MGRVREAGVRLCNGRVPRFAAVVACGGAAVDLARGREHLPEQRAAVDLLAHDGARVEPRTGAALVVLGIAVDDVVGAVDLVPLEHDHAHGLRRCEQSLMLARVALTHGLPAVAARGAERGVPAAGAAARAGRRRMRSHALDVAPPGGIDALVAGPEARLAPAGLAKVALDAAALLGLVGGAALCAPRRWLRAGAVLWLLLRYGRGSLVPLLCHVDLALEEPLHLPVHEHVLGDCALDSLARARVLVESKDRFLHALVRTQRHLLVDVILPEPCGHAEPVL
eukprot:scaffold53740_cov68-Phaeocystis_antarctica.AAC.7